LEEDRRRITELETELKQTSLKLKRSERAQQQEARAKALLEKRYEKLKEKYEALREANKKENVADDDDDDEKETKRRASRGSRGAGDSGGGRAQYLAKLRNRTTKVASPQKGRKGKGEPDDDAEDDDDQDMEKENHKPKQTSHSSRDGRVLRNGRVVDTTGGGELDVHFDKLTLAGGSDERGRRKHVSRDEEYSGVRTRAQAESAEYVETDEDEEEDEDEDGQSRGTQQGTTPIGKRLPRRGAARK
jgi:hypothetical protein